MYLHVPGLSNLCLSEDFVCAKHIIPKVILASQIPVITNANNKNVF